MVKARRKVLTLLNAKGDIVVGGPIGPLEGDQRERPNSPEL